MSKFMPGAAEKGDPAGIEKLNREPNLAYIGLIPAGGPSYS